ncbi:MAG: hypothetical protein HGA51_00550 [Demequinaceae bacterium]|nr:hypothetical protein [Demequinaceae bacterium]
MDALQTVFLILHFLGLAAILGGSLEQWRTGGKLTTLVTLWGARAQLITGLALAGIVSSGNDDDTPSPAKLAVKLVIALAVAAVAEMNAKKPTIANSARLMVALTTVNVIVAVAWN